MSSNIITVNEKKEYHNCEMTFSFYYNSDKSDFKVDEDQKYTIHTTIKEVEALNEALNLYQSEGFKDNYLLYSNAVDASNVYPNFVIDYIDSVELTKVLQSLANDEDSLVQLSEYCLEMPPTYEDDFRINKKIESISIDGEVRIIDDYDDLEEFISELKTKNSALFT